MGEIRTRSYRPEDAEIWDQLVERSVNGTLFHRRRFLAYHPPGRFEDRSLLFYEGGKLRALFPAAVREQQGLRILRSHPGASYGGLVVPSPPGVSRAFALVDALLLYAAEAGFDRIELRTPPRIYSAVPVEEIELAMLQRGLRVVESELSTCYRVGQLGDGAGDEEVLATFSEASRRAARKARRAGLRVERVTDPERFADYHAMLRANLQKHGASPTHSVDELVDLQRRFPEEVWLLGVFDGDAMAAGVVTFCASPRVAHCFYFASRAEAQPKRPLNLAVLELIKRARARGIEWLNFGISTEDHGRAINAGLFRFKESFGGGGVMRCFWRGEVGGEEEGGAG